MSEFGQLLRAMLGLDGLERRILAAIHQSKEDIIMAGQASIDAATAALTQMQTSEAADVAQLLTDFANIQAEIAALKGQGVSTDALDAAVTAAQATAATLDPAVASITGLNTP